MKLRELSLCLLLASALPAHAGLFDDEEARRRIEQIKQDLDNRLLKVETSADTTSRAQVELNGQLERMRQEVAQLRGQLELLSNENEQAQKRQKDFYVDLDARLRKFEGQSGSAAATATNQTASSNTEAKPADQGQEARDYEAAINLLRSNKHVDAIFAFKQFIKSWPKSSFQPGAHFWAGAALLQARDFEGAKEYYAKLVSIWPEDTLAPDAMLGQANAEEQAGAAKTSRATLEKLVAAYPNSEAAKTAKQRLKKK
ncbi:MULTISPECIES: tol-pal system protein YbgF [Uliginosibacterium]|uniref:Cell division coordinator CpoB n=1 Tax=Uliginosibacterium aquaticum TaxID=2731212 RepID=A0ABX2IHG8_9RHOO|nr:MULTISPECIES: tol-pal system protein YbgF [Uliginosibacterium]MDO6386678.1 tol-pal system protein YbgF [Uliginosibacterium sp. 31-12]NSL55732.1 tol-pal system protein YbgF [Uliginosibacterium aquaticum]PLK50507.1 tol-pal system protein YbgF [Uliginosibacterium sp. TH139]